MLLRALFKRPTPGAPAGAATTWRLNRIGMDHVRRYNAVFGFPDDDIPLTFLYLLAQRAQLASMLAQPIPFRIPGLIHVENRLAMHGPVVPDVPLAITTRLLLPPVAANGAHVCTLETRAHDGERLVFSCDSTYLIRRGNRAGGGSGKPLEPPRGEVLGTWQVAPDEGRRYAALSGDWNPIHLWSWSARLMGMRRPIIHGAHTLARACALLQASSGSRVASVWCRFRQPVALGSKALLMRGARDDFSVECDGRVALEGTATF